MEPQELIFTDPNSLRFGDIVINHWASDKNPNKRGIVISVKSKTVYCTNGKGVFWNLVKDSKSKIERVGSILKSIPNT